MPRGRAQGRGRGRRRGRSCDRRPCTRRMAVKTWTGSAESLVPPANPQLPAATLPPPTTVAQFRPDQPPMVILPHFVEECSQDSTLWTALLSAVVKCHLKAEVGEVLQNEGIPLHSAADSEGAKVHFSLDTNALTANTRKSSATGESNVYRSVSPSPQSLYETNAGDFENFKFHSLRKLASRNPAYKPDRNAKNQTVFKGRAQNPGSRSTETDHYILDTDFVNSSKYVSSTKQDKSLFADHNHNFLSCSTSGSSLEVFQSGNENSVGASSPATKHQCFHSTVPSTLYNGTAVNGKSASTSIYCSSSAKNDTLCVSQKISEPSRTVWDFAPPLEVSQMLPVPFDRPNEQQLKFIIKNGRDSVLPGAEISCQPEFTLPSRNTSTLHSLTKWRYKAPSKKHLSKLRSVKSANAGLRRIQKDECSRVVIALEQGFSVFCCRCYRPGRMHPRNQNKIIKKKFHRKYWNNLHILKNQKLAKISDKNCEIKCCSCHRPLWKCHKNNKMFRIREMTSNSHPNLASNRVMNETEEITKIRLSETEDSTLKTTDRLQNHLSIFSDKHITNTASEDDGSKVRTNLQQLSQNLDLTSKVKFPNETFVFCLTSEKDTENIVGSQHVQVPCQTGQEFMEMSNKFNPYPYKISGIFGSKNGISACLEDQGDLSNEFDFDINNSGELTLPSYEPQLVVSKDKAETWNFGENNVFVTVMRKHAEGISHFVQTPEKTARNSETAETPTDNAKPSPDVEEQVNSIDNTHQGSNKALSEEMSLNGEETIGNKKSSIRTKEMNSVNGETYHADVVLQTNGTPRGQLTSIENMHNGNKQELSEKISSDINNTVFHRKNCIENVRITAHNHKIDYSFIMPRTVDNMREQLNPTEKTMREDTDAQLREISRIMMEKFARNKGTARRGSYIEESAGQSSAMNVFGEAECSVCIKEEVGEYKKETLEVLNANLLRNTDLCSNHSTCREKTNTCETSPVCFSDGTTVKEEAVKDEEEDLGPGGTCYSLHCYMCDAEKKLLLQMPATINSEPVDATSSPILASKDKLLAKSWNNDVSSDGCSFGTNSSINNSSGEGESLLVQSSGSIANSTDLTRSDKEELYQKPNSRRSPGKTVEKVPERNEATLCSATESLTGQVGSMTMELQEPINSPDFFCSDNNNWIEEQGTEQLNSLSSNTNEAFDYVANEHEADEIETQLRNLFSENSEDSSSSEIQVNDTLGSVLFLERDTEYKLCKSQEELSNQSIPHGRENCSSGIAHEDRFHLTCDSSSTKESQNCVADVEHKLTERTEDGHNAENEKNGDMSAVIPRRETMLGSINQPITEHEVGYQQSSDISSTNECRNNLIMKDESSSDQEQGSCISYSVTDSDSNSSVQIEAEIRRSESNVNNQKQLCTYPLSSINNEDIPTIVGSGSSHISSTTEMMHSEIFVTDQADGSAVSQCPVSTFKTKQNCKSLDSDCTSKLVRAPLDHSEGTSNNLHVDSQMSKYPQNSLDSHDTCDNSNFGRTSTSARTLENSIDFASTCVSETMHYLKNTTDSPEVEQKDVPVIRVSIPLSSITDPGLLESLMSERKRRKAGHTGPPLTQAAERRNLEKLSDVQYSSTYSSKRKAINKYEIRRMNGRGKRTFEKVSQGNEVREQSPVPDPSSHKDSEKYHENDDAGARDEIQSSNTGTTKCRSVLDSIEKHNAKALCKEKNAHQSAVVAQCEDGSEEEGELQICEEPLEGGEEGAAQDKSEENVAVLSHDNILEEKWVTSKHICEPDTLIKAKDIEGCNATAHQRDEHKPPCKRKLFSDNEDESQVIGLSNIVQKESLSPPQKLPEIKQPYSPLQKVEHHFSRTCLSDETSGPTVSGDGRLSDVKTREALEHDASGVPVALQSEKDTLSFDEGSNILSSDHRMNFEDTATPFRKISRKNINEEDVHVKISEEKEIGDSSLHVNKVLMCSSSKSSTRRISSKGRMKYVDLDTLPPSYKILRRDLNEVLEQENLYQTSYSLPRKVPKKLSVTKAGGYRRPRECQKIQMVSDAAETISKKIRKEESEPANSDVSGEDQEKAYVQKQMEYIPDQNIHTTKSKCEQDTNLTALENPDVNQHHKKKKPAVVQSEEMEVCHDKSTLPEKETAVSTGDQTVAPLTLKRFDGSSWIQCVNGSTVVETGGSTEKTPVLDKCGESDRVPDKNVAAQEGDDHDDTSSVSSRHSETEMVNRTSIAKEQLSGQPKHLLTKRNTSQNIQEYDHKSLVCTGRKDDENRLCVEVVHSNPQSKLVEVTDEAVCFQGHKLVTEASHSQDNKLPSLIENKKSNVCTEGEQSHQCLSQSPDEITAPENNANNPHQATTHNSPIHLQSRQEDFVKEDRGNRQQDHSVNCGVVEGDETNRSSYKVAASHSEDEVPQDCVERRSNSPHFMNIDRQVQGTTAVCWQQKFRETMADLFLLMERGEPFKNAAVTMMTQALEQIQEAQNKTQQSLQHKIQTEEHVSVCDTLSDNTKEQSVQKQQSQDPKAEFQHSISEREETNQQHITQNTSQKSAIDFQDPVEELPLKHTVSDGSKTNEQHIIQKSLQESTTDFQDPIEKLPLKHLISECDETNEQDITQKPLQKSANDFQDPAEELPLKAPVIECDETTEQHITQKSLQNSATDVQEPVENLPLKYPVSECDKTNKQHITQKPLQKTTTDFQDPLEKVPLKHPLSDCGETNEQHITQKPLQKSSTDFQDPFEKGPLKHCVSECTETNERHVTQKPLQKSLCDETHEQHITQKPLQKSATDFQDHVKKLPKSTIFETVSHDVALTRRESSTNEVGRSHPQTESGTVSPTQHTGCGSQIHDIGPQPCTSQSQQTGTSKQFLPRESVSCSGHLKQYSKETLADQEETIGQQKADEQYAKERQLLQGKCVEPHNSQAQMLTQQQVQDQHRIMLNTIKQQKQQFSSVQQIAQEKDVKCHREVQQSSLQPSVIQSRVAVQQWHHTQQRASQHHQIQCMDMDKAVPQQHNVYSGPTEAEKAASIVQNPMGCHQALFRQQQQMQHIASLEQQPLRQLSAVPNPMAQPQQPMQQQMEWQQQRGAHVLPKQYPTVEHQSVPQNQQQAHPYNRFYFPQMQQPYQLPHSTEVPLRPSYPHQYHSRFTAPQTLNSNSHLLRQMPCGPLDGQQLQPQQQQYPHYHHQQQLEKWHLSRRPGAEEAATVPAVLASPSMSGGTVVESEHDRRRILSREVINSFDAGHRIGAVPSSSCPVTPANTENIHTAQPAPSQAYMRAGPHPQPNNSTAPTQAPLNTGSVHQRAMNVVPTSTVDEDQRPTGQGGRLKIPTPPRVSAFVERIMKNYQPDILSTEDIYRHQYKLPERELAAQFAFPQESVYTRHGTTSVQLPYSQPVMMFSEHTRFPASITQPLLNKTVHSFGQSLHRVFVPPPASSFNESVDNSPVNVAVNCVQPTPMSKNVNVHYLHTSSSRISQEASPSSVRDSENVNCDCNVIDLSQDKNTSEDNGRCHIVKRSERTPKGTELDRPVMEKTDSPSLPRAVDEVPQPLDYIQDNVPDNPQLTSSTAKTAHHLVPLGKKRKSEILCGTPEKRLCQDTDSEARALSNTGTHQATAMDLSPSTVVECNAVSTPSQSSPHMLGTSCPPLCATSRPALDSKQQAVNGKGAGYGNGGQQNEGLCTASCCGRSRCASQTTRLAAAGTAQQSQHSPNDERCHSLTSFVVPNGKVKPHTLNLMISDLNEKEWPYQQPSLAQEMT